MQERTRLLPIVGFIALTLGVGSLPGVFIQPGASYASQPKPWFTPPGWVIGSVWSVLFTLIGTAAGIVYQRPARAGFFRVYALNLGLNVLWTPLFFGLRRPDLALVEIVPLWASTLALVLSARRRSRPAGLLLWPYLAWVTFAAFLNFSIVNGLFVDRPHWLSRAPASTQR